ncbi:MAG: hypothetical protein KAR06_00115 [Deltaproteobacteria bacterium]|nr:hypothetical protein [Deltaproteobacteria bacterium]
MVPNGLIVQDTSKHLVSEDCPYKGIGAYPSWPLDNQDVYSTDEPSRVLTDTAHRLWFDYQWEDEERDIVSYPIAAAPDIEFTIAYVKRCKELGMEPRVLVVESDRELPQMDYHAFRLLTADATFIGFDYLSSQDLFSAIYDDFFRHDLAEFALLRTMLNEYGVFPNDKFFQKYITLREEALERGSEVETGLDLIEMGLSVITPETLTTTLSKLSGLTIA